MSAPTFTDQIQELDREIKTRERVFPRWVASGKLTAAIAQHRIDCMKSALQTLMGLPLAMNDEPPTQPDLPALTRNT